MPDLDEVAATLDRVRAGVVLGRAALVWLSRKAQRAPELRRELAAKATILAIRRERPSYGGNWPVRG